MAFARGLVSGSAFAGAAACAVFSCCADTTGLRGVRGALRAACDVECGERGVVTDAVGLTRNGVLVRDAGVGEGCRAAAAAAAACSAWKEPKPGPEALRGPRAGEDATESCGDGTCGIDTGECGGAGFHFGCGRDDGDASGDGGESS